MDHSNVTTIVGRVADVFAHRFIVDTPSGRVLADLGPKGAERVVLRRGDEVEACGEMKPSELKVRRIVLDGRTFDIEHGKPADADPDPRMALDTVAAKGFTILGAPRRKPKHFEILGRDRSGALTEVHVEHDGTLRKTKPVDRDDPRWHEEIAADRTGG